ncbi:astacin (Peptidase family m12A) domain-containing protein [Ditylenchus destructor]|nr:astacin (Peptidase family m12A) domain-containing protein [Ditylenchus destructor]
MAPQSLHRCRRSVSVHHCRLFRWFLFIFYCLSCSNALFLRPSRELTEDVHFEIGRSLSDRSSTSFINDLSYRDKRSVTGWQNEIRRKAESFGQSEDEIEQVHHYLEKLKEVAEEKHPSIRKSTSSPQSSRFTSLVNISATTNETETEIHQQMASWNNRRMSADEELNPEENGRHFEGDIILLPDQAEELYQRAVEGDRRRVKRKFIGSKVRRWDSTKPIIYSFDGSHTLREQRVIELALEHWQNITCLNFERHNDEPKGNRIVFTDVDGCASNVGKHPLGEPQFVSLAPECIRLGVIAHEVAHALGFWHEQSRPDRDVYVRVRWFLKEQPADVDNGDVPYDYGSIMHYRSKAFAKYDDLFTMSTFISDYQRTIGQRDQLSFNDIRLMNVIYCKHACPRELPCQRGGYTDPRKCDRCRCPDGFTGHLCEQVMPGYGAECGGRMELTSSWSRIQSPGYPAEFHEGQECSWLLVAPKGQRVQFQFTGEFEMYCKVRHSLCMDYVEIRNSTDFANTGMRYCCFGTPQSSIVSATEDMLVLFRSFYRGGKGFVGQMRAISASSVNPTEFGGLPRPHVAGGNLGSWKSWSEWTSCSATCGSCGLRNRSRQCDSAAGLCLGDEEETEICNRQPCKGLCPRKRVEESNCTGLLGLLKGVRCKTEKTQLEECEEICCAGFSLIDGQCSR